MSIGVLAQAHRTVIFDTLLGLTIVGQVGLPLLQSVREIGRELIIDQTAFMIWSVIICSR